MTNDILILTATAATIGFIHTLLGPDHYVPFIAISRARRWSWGKTALITLLCGFAHVLSSVVVGVLGIAFGLAVSKLESAESSRASIAGWALIVFGLVYCVWGLKQALRNKAHAHSHVHKDGSSHVHAHGHIQDHMHVHGKEGKRNITPWVLFIIFVFGPCEPLIPLLMYPAAKESIAGLVLVTLTFSVVTIMTMLGIVLMIQSGFKLIPATKLERYSHALAGATILMCGLAIRFMGL